MIHFIISGWAAKCKDLMDGFSANARLEYFKMFGRSFSCANAEATVTEFLQFHNRWYGRRYFIAPFILLFLTRIIGVSTVAFTGVNRLGYSVSNIAALPDTAMAAFAGAHLLVADDLIPRARLDMAPSDLMWAALRLVISIPMGYAFAAILTPALAHLTTLALGAFDSIPRPMRWRMTLSNYRALTANVERYAIEGITTITQIAYCDPVRLIMPQSGIAPGCIWGHGVALV